MSQPGNRSHNPTSSSAMYNGDRALAYVAMAFVVVITLIALGFGFYIVWHMWNAKQNGKGNCIELQHVGRQPESGLF
jgi:predicted negative regulator of RcsB-dependent stress response